MKYRSACIGILVVCFLASPGAVAQLRDPGLGFYVGGGGTIGQNDDLINRQIELQGRAAVRFGIVAGLQGEIGGGLGWVSGKESVQLRKYKTQIIPADFRLLVSPFDAGAVNPFLYVGGGAIRWKVKDLEYPPSEPMKLEGWVGYVPGGAGLQIRLSDNAALELSGGYNYIFTDDIDALRTGPKGMKDAYWSFLGGLAFFSESGGADPDNDGLSNQSERQLGTNPRNADSDGDGLKDGEEFDKHKTNPLSPDSDGDGLADGDEVLRYRTNPAKADGDGDGLNDGEEISKHNTDPAKADSDADGLSDGEEVLTHKTNPSKADTDGDGLSDGEEIRVHKTDPVKADSDSDGLNDRDEVTRYKTDPLKADTDGGSVNDGQEAARGTNPLDREDDVPKVGKKIVLEGVTFASGKSELTPESAAKLDQVYQTLVDFPEMEVEISGHTDNTGKRSRNTNLSAARATAVKEYLVKRGIDTKRIRTVGYGPDRPAAPNTTPEGRAKNRRIEFSRTK